MKLPARFGWFVVAGALGFEIVTMGLAAPGVLMVLRAYQSPVSAVNMQGILVLALSVSLILSLFRRDKWKGIELQTCPALEDILAHCSQRADVPVPEHIYLTPDASIAAVSSGPSRAQGSGTNLISIGALLLIILNREELESAIAHEIAHIRMRRAIWFVGLEHYILSAIPRMNLISKHVYERLNPSLLVLTLYWYSFSLLMAPLRRKEELLADDLAARLCGEAPYAKNLAHIVTVQTALETRGSDGKSVSFLDYINGHFHALLLDMRADAEVTEFPNWFEFGRYVLSSEFEELACRTRKALTLLRNQEAKVTR